MRRRIIVALALIASAGLLADERTLSDLVSVSVAHEIDSAYVYNGFIYSDRPVWSLGPTVEFHLNDDWRIGTWAWFLTDLTNRRHSGHIQKWMNEKDYGVYISGTVWDNGESVREMRLALETVVGYEWMTYSLYPSIHYPTFELRFANPHVTPYVKTFYEFRQLSSLRYEFGLDKSVPLSELTEASVFKDVSFEMRLAAHGGHSRLLACNWGVRPDHGGIGTLEGRAGISWSPLKHLRFGAFVAYDAIVHDDLRHKLHGDSPVPDWSAHSQLVWCGINATISF